MSTIKVLVVVDGNSTVGPGFSLAPYQDPTDNTFTISTFLSTLQNSVFPSISVDTAHRRENSWMITPGGTTEHPTFENFNFATSIPDLSVYDEIWMFGYEGTNIETNPGALAFIQDDELAAIARFMNGGGGVFAAGDHAGLGSLMCGKILRVRSMRKWFAELDNDPTIPPEATRNWPGSGPTRADTLQPFDDGSYNFDNQSDDIPMKLDFPSEPAHPILQGPYGEIGFFPDHMHEGEVLGYGGTIWTPWSLTYNFNQIASAAIPAASFATALTGTLAINSGGTNIYTTKATDATVGDVVQDINGSGTGLFATLDIEGHGHLVVNDTMNRGSVANPLFGDAATGSFKFAGDASETFTNTINTASDTLTFNSQSFVEYPIGCPSAYDPDGWQERPSIIAMGDVIGGHPTPREGSMCEQNNFQPDPTPTTAKRINVLCVYDGQNACTTDTWEGTPRVGRVVTDSSFHHYLDLNLIGDPCGVGRKQLGLGTPRGAPLLANLKAFYINTVVWLANKPRLEVGLSPNPVPAGQNATGTVEVNTVIPDGGLQFNLTSSNPLMVAVQSEIRVLPDPASANFNITTSVVPPGAQASAYITATYKDAPPPGIDPSARALLTVMGPPPPPPPPCILLSLIVSPEQILFGDSAVGRVTIGPCSQDVNVVLSSASFIPVATLPPSVTIPAGQTTATFEIDTSYVRSRAVTVTIYASAGGVKLEAELIVSRVLPQP